MKQNIKMATLAVFGAFLLTLCGCAVATPSVEDLLRAPILSGDYSDIQTALMERYDSTVQLKYPTEGELLSPFAFGDWDGDGAQEAVALFTIEGTTNVLVGILKQDDAGEWQVIGTANGLSDTVTTLAFASMQEGDAQQIVATFQAQGAQYLAVYDYQDGWLTTVFQQPYNQYLMEDITGTDTDDLILISTSEGGALQMELFTFTGDGFTTMLVPSFNSEPFTSYLSIATTKGSYSRQYLMIDGFVGEGQTTVTTELLWYNTVSGTFERATLAGTDDLFNDAKRYSADLISQDIDGNGVVDVPVQYSAEGGVLNHVQTSPVYLIAWMDFTNYNPQKSVGLFDDAYNYYLELPDEVMGNLLIVDGEDDIIEVRNLSGDLLYFSLRVVDFDETDSGWYPIGTVASKQIQVEIGEESSDFITVYSLSRSVYLL